MTTPGVDFFRVDQSGSVRNLLIIAGALVMLGAFLIGGHLVSRLDEGTSHLISLAGGLIVIVGLILGFGAMAMILFENVYLLIKPEGLVCHENGKETVIPWADLATVNLGGNGTIVFERAGTEALRWFTGRSAKEVAAKIEEARRKAIHGLLPGA